jgi:hypothetical protein
MPVACLDTEGTQLCGTDKNTVRYHLMMNGLTYDAFLA